MHLRWYPVALLFREEGSHNEDTVPTLGFLSGRMGSANSFNPSPLCGAEGAEVKRRAPDFLHAAKDHLEHTPLRAPGQEIGCSAKSRTVFCILGHLGQVPFLRPSKLTDILL